MRGDQALGLLCGYPWAITEEKLRAMLDIVVTIQDGEIATAALKEEELPEHTSNRVRRHGAVAVIDVQGPIFRRANLFHRVSGGASIELFDRDFKAALTDARVEAILLSIDSPGGEAKGVSEMASKIHDGRKVKPVWAYVESQALSGGYWLASAASRIVLHKTAYAGSVGVVASVTDSRERKKRDGYTEHEFVSSQSPLKRMDPATDAGREQLQRMVDELAAHFIADVAAFRDVTAEHVTEKFGRGGMLIAKDAVSAGMADETGTYEGAIGRLSGETLLRTGTLVLAASAKQTETVEEEVQRMAEEKQPVEQAGAAAVTANDPATKARIRAILECEEARGRDALARCLAFDDDMDPEKARKFLAAAPAILLGPAERNEPAEDQFSAHMKTVANPKVGVQGEDQDDVAKEVAAISSYIPPPQRRKAS
jgi:signal peptide peptidase SppA